MSFENVLVFGSKSPYKIPIINVTEIFSSNGSAELVNLYNRYNNKHSTMHSCVIGARSFLKLTEIKKRVINSEPDTLIVRDHEDAQENIKKFFKNDLDICKFSKNKQFLFQSKFFNKGIVDLMSAEASYQSSFKKKITHIFNGIFKYGFFGVSSGFFALLLAAKKYPNSNLIVSGLSFKGGTHFYSKGEMTLNRGNVDKILMNNLSEDIKKRIFIIDREVATNFRLKEFKGKILNI